MLGINQEGGRKSSTSSDNNNNNNSTFYLIPSKRSASQTHSSGPQGEQQQQRYLYHHSSPARVRYKKQKSGHETKMSTAIYSSSPSQYNNNFNILPKTCCYYISCSLKHLKFCTYTVSLSLYFPAIRGRNSSSTESPG